MGHWSFFREVLVLVKGAQLCPTLCDPTWPHVTPQRLPTLCDPMWQHAGLLCLWNSPGKNTGVGSHFLLQGNFPTQGLNLDLLLHRQILYLLSHQGSPGKTSPQHNQRAPLLGFLHIFISTVPSKQNSAFPAVLHLVLHCSSANENNPGFLCVCLYKFFPLLVAWMLLTAFSYTEHEFCFFRLNYLGNNVKVYTWLSLIYVRYGELKPSYAFSIGSLCNIIK